MFVSFCYLVLLRLLQLVAFRVRCNEWKELEIVVLCGTLRGYEAAVPDRAASHETPAASSFLYLISASG